MFTFKDFLSKDILLIESKNMHLSHIEDTILDSGYSGAKSTIDTLENIIGMLAGHTDSDVVITTKYDGNPALICGYNPENNKFFVGTKSALNKNNPRICYTPEDIDEYYGNIDSLSNKLHAALKYLPEIRIKGVLHGDVLFGPNEVTDMMIEGEPYVTFHPNTIVYAVPQNSDLAKKIKQAKFGIIFHSVYEGNDLRSLHKSHKDPLKGLRKSKNVWFDDATYKDVSGVVTMTEDETQEAEELLQHAKKVLAMITTQDFTKIHSNKTYISILKQYQNYLIRKGKHIDDVSSWSVDLPSFLEKKISKEKTKQETKDKKLKRMIDHTNSLEDSLRKLLDFQKTIVKLKLLLLEKLESAKDMGTFHKTNKGLVVSKGEGFVCSDHIGNVTKLVDRLEFTKHNWSRRENEEMTSVTNTPPLLPKGTYMGGETGLAGKNPSEPSYHGPKTGQYTDSTGAL